MKKIFVAALVSMVTLAASAQTPAEVAAKYNEAGPKVSARDFAGAIAILEEVIVMGEAAGEEAAPTVKMAQDMLPRLYLGYAGSLANTQKFEDALAVLAKAAESPDATSAARAKGMIAQINNVLGGTAWNSEDFAAAAEFFAKAHEANPADVKTAAQLAESYGKIKEYEKSYALFRELIAQDPADVDALKGRLGFYMLLNANEIRDEEPAKAVEILTEAVELDNNPQAWMLLLQTVSGMNDNAKVIEFGARAAEAQTDAVQKSNAYSLLGVAYEKTGDKAQAIEAFRKVTAGPNVAIAKENITVLQAQ